jgi:hypothetical protein
MRFGAPLAALNKLYAENIALLDLLLCRLREPFASRTFVSEHDPRPPGRNHLAFEPPQPRVQAPATHFRQPDLFWSAVRSNSAKRASISSTSIPFIA